MKTLCYIGEENLDAAVRLLVAAEESKECVRAAFGRPRESSLAFVTGECAVKASRSPDFIGRRIRDRSLTSA